MTSAASGVTMGEPTTVGAGFGAPTGRTSALQQWWVLTLRGLTGSVRNGELAYSFISPALLAVCFYVPLRNLVDSIGFDFAQYLMPIVVLQSVAFVASNAAMRAALDRQEGVNNRFQVLPMPAAVPLLARTATNAVLLLVALACGLAASWLMGWRPVYDDGPGLAGTAAVMAIAAVVGVILALTADAIGLLAPSPEATSQLIAFPTLILGMLSSGFIPVQAFPSWIRGFVRNQPVSQFTTVMRSAENGTLTWHSALPSILWCLGIATVAAVLFAIHVRRTR